MWTQATYSYLATISANLTLTFAFQTNNNDNWYLDDVSVKDPTSVEMLTNNDFESAPLLTGWTTGSTGSCTGQSGISTTKFQQITLITTRAVVQLPRSRNRSLPSVVKYTMLLSGIITIITQAVEAHLYNLL